MKKSEAKPGVRVMASVNSDEWSDGEIVKYAFNEFGEYTLRGVILNKAGANSVWVKFDESDFGYDDEDEEVDVKLLALESDEAAIEAEFKSVQKEIKEKMKEAAKLINEAGKMAKSAHIGSLESLYDATLPLVDAMDNNGWRSSSWGC